MTPGPFDLLTLLAVAIVSVALSAVIVDVARPYAAVIVVAGGVWLAVAFVGVGAADMDRLPE